MDGPSGMWQCITVVGMNMDGWMDMDGWQCGRGKWGMMARLLDDPTLFYSEFGMPLKWKALNFRVFCYLTLLPLAIFIGYCPFSHLFQCFMKWILVCFSAHITYLKESTPLALVYLVAQLLTFVLYKRDLFVWDKNCQVWPVQSRETKFSNCTNFFNLLLNPRFGPLCECCTQFLEHHGWIEVEVFFLGGWDRWLWQMKVSGNLRKESGNLWTAQFSMCVQRTAPLVSFRSSSSPNSYLK